MSGSSKRTPPGAMLDAWRPPPGAGDPIGCLASTYTFNPGLFDEYCLPRFLEIDSEPHREGVAFVIEREVRLGAVYAGVLVDYTQAGVQHSLRWDVLPVRVPGGKQHSKVSLLAWTNHTRVIVASANLSEPGYRTNHEVAAVVDFTPQDCHRQIRGDVFGFLRNVISLVAGAVHNTPEVRRAREFLDLVERQAQEWTMPSPAGKTARQFFVPTLPASISSDSGTLEQAIRLCRKRGGSPSMAWIASPFFDVDQETNRVSTWLCKAMARGVRRRLKVCVPAVTDEESQSHRLAAPRSLITTPKALHTDVDVELLPDQEGPNLRPWHAKMVAFFLNQKYSAMMVGSSNFTCAGMGVGRFRNVEANLLTVVDYQPHGKEEGRLRDIWPEMEVIDDPDEADWLGAQNALEEEELSAAVPLPGGFLVACYRAGDSRQLVLRFDPSLLPAVWSVWAHDRAMVEVLAAESWHQLGQPTLVELPWSPIQPPEKLVVRWDEGEACWPLNVEDTQSLPPPARLESMTAEEMLRILTATDPSGAFRAWARRHQLDEGLDEELDSASIDLDPLRYYDLQTTFLHRVRRRARTFALLRNWLQRPVWSQRALDARLRGLIGVQALADRLWADFASADAAADEALLSLADFLIVLREVDYHPADGFLTKAAFNQAYRAFLDELASKLAETVGSCSARPSGDVMEFWERVLGECCR